MFVMVKVKVENSELKLSYSKDGQKGEVLLTDVFQKIKNKNEMLDPSTLMPWKLEPQSDGQLILRLTDPKHDFELALMISDEGHVRVQSISSNVALDLSTIGDVHIQTSDLIDSLMIDAEQVHLYKPIEANTLKINSKLPLKNHTTLNVRDFSIAAPLFINYHDIACETMSVRLEENFYNLGSVEGTQKIHICSASGNLRNQAQSKIVSKRDMILDVQKGILNNQSYIKAHKKLDAKFHKLKNAEGATLEADEFKIVTKTKSWNAGNLLARDFCYHSSQLFSNASTGRIHGKDKCMLSSYTKIHNEGGISSLAVLECVFTELYNAEQGFIHSQYAIRFTSGGTVENLGEIYGQVELNCPAALGISNHETGIMFSKNCAYFKAVAGKVSNLGKMGGGIWVDLQARDLNIGTKAVLVSMGNLYTRLSADMDNAGKMAGGRFLSITAASLINRAWKGVTGEIVSYQDLEMAIQSSIDNYGKVGAKENATLHALLRYDNHPGATTAAGEFLNVKSCKIHNHKASNKANLSAANPICEAMTTMDQADRGLFGAGRGLLLEATMLSNDGILFSSGTLNVEVESKFKNLLGAYILAYGANEIKSREILINAGLLSGKSNLFLSSPQLVNLVGGRIAAEQLVAESETLKNSGLVAANHLRARVKDVLENYLHGKFQAIEVLEILAGKAINEGILDSARKIVLNVQTLIENAGKISAKEQVELLCADIIKNTAHIESLGSIHTKARKILNASLESKIISVTDLEILATFAIENVGVLSGKTVHLKTTEASSFIKTVMDSQVSAKTLSIDTHQVWQGGTLSAEHLLSINAVLCENIANGLMRSQDVIDIKANKFINAGVVTAARNLSMDVKELLDNQETGKLSSGDTLALLCASIIQNSGDIAALGNIKAEAKNILNSLKLGKIVSQAKLELLVQFAIENAGVLSGETVVLKTQQIPSALIKNFVDAQIISKNTMILNSDYAENAGQMITTAGSISADMVSVFDNVATGKISAHDAITIKAEEFKNAGLIEAKKKLLIEVKTLLDNHASGTLSAREQVGLICGAIIKNAGKINSLANIKIEAQQILQSVCSGEMICAEKLELVAKFLIDNSGLISGGTTLLTTTDVEGWIKNLSAGVLTASECLELSGAQGENFGKLLAKKGTLTFDAEFRNEGIIETQADLTIKAAQTLWLLREGRITAKTSLSLLSDLKIYSEGDILAFEALSMAANIIDQPGGQVESLKNISLQAIDWILGGNVKAGHDLLVKVKGQWDYQESGSFEAGNTADLNLELGYTFTKPMAAKANLHFHCLPQYTFRNLSTVSAVGDLIISGGTIINGAEGTSFAKLQAGHRFESIGASFDNVNGGVYAKDDLCIEARSGIRNGRAEQKNGRTFGNGAYLASGGTATFNSAQGGLANEYNNMEFRSHLNLNLAGTLNNPGKISVGGNATIKTAELRQQMLTSTINNGHTTSVRSLSDNPLLSVGGNLDLWCQANLLGADIHVGGNLVQHRGGIDAKLVEIFDYWLSFHTRKVGHRHWYKHRKEEVYSEGHRHTHAVYYSNVSANRGISGHDISARYQFEGSMHTAGAANLEFSDLNISNQLDAPKIPQKNPEIDINHYHSPFNRMYVRETNSNASSLYRSELPFSQMYHDPEAVLARAVIVGNDAAHTSLIPKITHFDLAMEADFVEQAFLERTGKYLEGAVGREQLYKAMRQNALEHAQALGVENLTESQLKLAAKPMLVYRIQQREGQAVLVAKLYVPKQYNAEVGFFAESSNLEGNIASRMHVGTKAEIKKLLNIKVGHLTVADPTVQEQVTLKDKRHFKTGTVTRQTGTASIHAGSINIRANTYHQTGAILISDAGGTYLEVRDSALLEALRVSDVERAGTRGGRDSIRPEFIPVKMRSLGNQTVIVLKGNFEGVGLESIAKGKNSIDALTGLRLRNAYEEYDLPENTKRKHRFKKERTGGTSFSSLSSVFQGGEGKESEEACRLSSSEGLIHLTNIGLVSMGDASIRGQKLRIDEAVGRETRFHHKSGFKGMGYYQSKHHQSTQTALQSQMMVKGKLHIQAIEEVVLRAVNGYVGGDAHIEALNVVIEGAIEKYSQTTKVKGVSLNFFGSDALEAVISGENSRAVLKKLLLNDSFAKALHHLKEAEGPEKPIEAIKTFMEGWRLAVTVAAVCREMRLGNDLVDSLGVLTDRWGLTRIEQGPNGKMMRVFDPKFNLNFARSKSVQNQTKNIPTTLMINGDLNIIGDIVRIKDGAQIDANNISIIARKCLEVTAGGCTQEFRHSSDSMSAGMTCTGNDISGSIAKNSRQSSETHYQNTMLRAKGLVKILSEGTVTLMGAELESKKALIQAAELIIQSLQDTSSTKSTHIAVSGSATGLNADGSIAGSSSAWVKQMSGIKVKETLDVITDYLLQNGSILSAGEKICVQALTKETAEWVVEDIEDYRTAEKTTAGISIGTEKLASQGPSAFSMPGYVTHSKSKTKQLNRATASAPVIEVRNREGDLVQDAIPAGINTDIGKAQANLGTKKSSFFVPIVTLDSQQLDKDVSTLKQGFLGKDLPPPKPSESELKAAYEKMQKSLELFEAEQKAEREKKEREKQEAIKKEARKKALEKKKRIARARSEGKSMFEKMGPYFSTEALEEFEHEAEMDRMEKKEMRDARDAIEAEAQKKALKQDKRPVKVRPDGQVRSDFFQELLEGAGNEHVTNDPCKNLNENTSKKNTEPLMSEMMGDKKQGVEKTNNAHLVGASLLSQGLKLKDPIVSHVRSYENAKSIILQGPQLRSALSNLYHGSAFYVSERGYAPVEKSRTHLVLFSCPKDMKIYKDTTVHNFLGMGKVQTDRGLVKRLLKQGFEAIQFEGNTEKPNGRFVRNLAIIKNPDQLKALGMYPVTSEAPFPLYPTRALQRVGVVGAGGALLFSGKKIIESDTPALEAGRQAVLFWAAYEGGKIAGAMGIIPCSKAGLLYPPAAPVIIPACIGGFAVVGGIAAAKGLDLTLEAGECVKKKIKHSKRNRRV